MLENLKGILILVVSILVIALLGLWAIRTLEPGDLSAAKQRQAELEATNQSLTIEVEELRNKVAELEAKQEEIKNTVVEVVETTPTITTYKHQSLINELNKLVTDKIYMKQGSRGTRVGTVQNFLNIYNNTSNKIDNDYGPTMKSRVTAFQKAEGLIADGEAGVNTFSKMIEWLKKQG